MTAAQRDDWRIWAYAFGYFACYAPYTALTKAITDGRLGTRIGGFELLPPTTLASLVGMMLFLSLMGWWKHASHVTILGASVPTPTRWTLLSGLCTAAIIATTTLAYTFEGVSIVFMMLLMRGGVLVIAPIVDLVSRRRVHWHSRVALALSFAALMTAVSSKTSLKLTLVAVIDVALYLMSYFVRLRFMSRLAKSQDRRDSIRFFVEEQMVATPAIVCILAIGALVGEGHILLELRRGFTTFWGSGVVLAALAVGVLSQGTGITGGLILLDQRENSFCVPVNRASSLLAGLLSSFGLALWFGTSTPPARELVGAGLVVAAIAVLALPTIRTRLSRVAPA